MGFRSGPRIRDQPGRKNPQQSSPAESPIRKNDQGRFLRKQSLPSVLLRQAGLHRLTSDPDALRILEHTTDVALPHLPGRAIEHGKSWRPGRDDTYTIDESYTIAENLFLAYQHGAGDRYRTLGAQYLDDEYFNSLAEGQSDFAGRHAYSHVN